MNRSNKPFFTLIGRMFSDGAVAGDTCCATRAHEAACCGATACGEASAASCCSAAADGAAASAPAASSGCGCHGARPA
jgi:hypothetical protein